MRIAVIGASAVGSALGRSSRSSRRSRAAEVDYLNGQVVRLGKELEVPAPINALVVKLMQRVTSERRYLTPARSSARHAIRSVSEARRERLRRDEAVPCTPFDAAQGRRQGGGENFRVTYLFDSRVDAARRLAKALDVYRGRNPLVLAIPRGAVEMGAVIAEALGGELDVVLVRKLRAPDSPEFAVGSVDETGWSYFAAHAREAGADEAYLATEAATQLELLRRRRALYTPARAPVDPAGRVAIVVDDGIATGASMIAALHAVRARNPAALVCAVPVAPPANAEYVRPYADQLVCLQTPREFLAVGQFYRHFPQVEDAEVVALLERHSAKREAQVSR